MCKNFQNLRRKKALVIKTGYLSYSLKVQFMIIQNKKEIQMSKN